MLSFQNPTLNSFLLTFSTLSRCRGIILQEARGANLRERGGGGGMMEQAKKSLKNFLYDGDIFL